MNRFKRTIAILRGRMSDSICHIGWGFMGQECDCGQVWPNMNWLARRTIKWGVGDWSDDDRPKTRRARVCVAIGDTLYGWGTRLINGPLMQEFYEAERQAARDKLAEAVANGGIEVDPLEEMARIFQGAAKTRKPYVRVTEAMADQMLAMWEDQRRYGGKVNWTRIAERFNVDPKTVKRHINPAIDRQVERKLREQGFNMGGIDDAMSILSSRGGRA